MKLRLPAKRRYRWLASKGAIAHPALTALLHHHARKLRTQRYLVRTAFMGVNVENGHVARDVGE